MAEFDLSPAQSGLVDEFAAEALAQTPAGVVARKPDGTMVEISPEGEVKELTEGDWQAGREEPADENGEAAEVDQLPTLEELTAEESPEAYKPPEVALAVDTRDPADVYRAMDRADEVLILDELMGRALDTMVYSFEQDGHLVTDLTVAGVNETVRLMNERGGTQVGISDQQPIVDEFRQGDHDYFRVLVFARDSRFPQSGRWGTAIEPVMMKRKNGGEKWDKFALTKALNKAQRNALRALIPEDFRQTIIALFLNKGKVQTLKPLGAGKVAELPPAVTGERAEALEREIREAYAELKALNPLRMPPARFNVFLVKAQISHEGLEDFREQLRQLVGEEKDTATGEQS